MSKTESVIAVVLCLGVIVIGITIVLSKPSTPVNERTVAEKQRIGTVMRIDQGTDVCYVYYGSDNQALSCIKK